MEIARRLNLSVVPSYQIVQNVLDETTIRERTYVQSQVVRPKTWEQHLDAHSAIRDLLSLSRWDEVPYIRHMAKRVDDPERSVGGAEVQQRWCQVRTYGTRQRQRNELDRNSHEFLFRYVDTGRRGIGHWLHLRDHFKRGVDPLISSIYGDEVSIQTLVTEICIGIEALGYQIALDSGLSERAANGLPFKARAHLLGEEIVLPLPFVVNDWAQRAADAYNGIKHANREMPDLVDALNVWRESVLAFRLWVATRIGATSEEVAERAKSDRMARPYEPA